MGKILVPIDGSPNSVRGLEKAIELNIKSLHIEGDSLLVINQLTGKYKCNSPNLIVI